MNTTRIPLLVYGLAAGTFVLGTSEFLVSGVLTSISADLNISHAQAGLLVTIFAFGIIIGAPATTALTIRLPKRTTLLAALLLFASTHVIIALATDFSIVLIARFFSAVATGAFWAVAMNVAARAVGPQRGSQAVGIIMGGGMLANVAGVPLGALVSQTASWRAPFWILAALAFVIAYIVIRQVPGDDSPTQTPSLKRELVGLATPLPWLALIASAGTLGGIFAAYTFIEPTLIEHAGMNAQFMPLALVVYGIGALVGVVIGGRLGDKYPFKFTITAASISVLTLFLMAFVVGDAWLAVAVISIAAITGFGVNPVAMSMASKFAPKSPTLAPALGAAFSNIGIAVASGLATVTLNSQLGYAGPPLLGAGLSLMTLAALIALAIQSARSARRINKPLTKIK